MKKIDNAITITNNDKAQKNSPSLSEV